MFLVMCYLIGLAVPGAFFSGDNVTPMLSRRRILWVEVFAKGCPDGICADTQEHITRCARARGLTQFSQAYMRLISGVRAALFSNLLGEHPQW